jgi:hypothetical protein
MLQVPAHQRSMLHMANASPELMARLLDNLNHGRRHHEGATENSPEVLMFRVGDLKESRNL